MLIALLAGNGRLRWRTDDQAMALGAVLLGDPRLAARSERPCDHCLSDRAPHRPDHRVYCDRRGCDHRAGGWDVGGRHHRRIDRALTCSRFAHRDGVGWCVVVYGRSRRESSETRPLLLLRALHTIHQRPLHGDCRAGREDRNLALRDAQTFAAVGELALPPPRMVASLDGRFIAIGDINNKTLSKGSIGSGRRNPRGRRASRKAMFRVQPRICRLRPHHCHRCRTRIACVDDSRYEVSRLLLLDFRMGASGKAPMLSEQVNRRAQTLCGCCFM